MVPHLWIIECHREMFGFAENLTGQARIHTGFHRFTEIGQIFLK